MGIQDKLMKNLMNNSMEQLGKVLESIHAHLEIISRESIRTRLEMKKSDVSEEEIDDVLEQYQKSLQ